MGVVLVVVEIQRKNKEDGEKQAKAAAEKQAIKELHEQHVAADKVRCAGWRGIWGGSVLKLWAALAHRCASRAHVQRCAATGRHQPCNECRPSPPWHDAPHVRSSCWRATWRSSDVPSTPCLLLCSN